jgi:uncharacterized CHY-type Zn-finger protein
MRYLIAMAVVVAVLSGCAKFNACFNCHHYMYADSISN